MTRQDAVQQTLTGTEGRKSRYVLRVLVVISDPLSGNLSSVAALQEWQAISRAMAHQQAPVTLLRLFPPTWQHLRQTLLGRLGTFDLVHFIGHGKFWIRFNVFGC